MAAEGWEPLRALAERLQPLLKPVSGPAPTLPYIGCLYKSNFVNTFFGTVTLPPLLIVVMVMLAAVGLQTRHQVWRNSVFLLFLIYPKTCEMIVNVFTVGTYPLRTAP